MALNKTQIKKLANRVASHEFSIRVETAFSKDPLRDQEMHRENVVTLSVYLYETWSIIRMLDVTDEVTKILPEAREEWSS